MIRGVDEIDALLREQGDEGWRKRNVLRAIINKVLRAAVAASEGRDEVGCSPAMIGADLNSENGRPTGKTRFTDIFLYRDGRWQCVAGHDWRFPFNLTSSGR